MSERHAPKRQGGKRPLVFLGVGIFNTLLDFGFYTLLTQTIFNGQNKIAVAGFVSGTIALLCAFLTHNFITWRERRADHKTIIKFFIFTGFGMWVLRPLLLSVFIHLDALHNTAYHVTSSISLPFSYDFVAKTCAFGFMVVMVLIYNYLAYDRFVFKPKITD